MQIKEHRIYKYMNQPIRLVGLTVDELLLSLGGIIGMVVFASLIAVPCFLLGTLLGVFFLKKYKKLTSGFSLKSYLHWSVGFRFGLPDAWPVSWERFWKS